MDASLVEYNQRLLQNAMRAVREGDPICQSTPLPGLASLCHLDSTGRLALDRQSMASYAPDDTLFGSVMVGLDGLWALTVTRVHDCIASTVRCFQASETGAPHDLPLWSGLPKERFSDAIYLVALDVHGTGWLLWLPVYQARRLHSSARSDFERIGAHVLTALTLRRRLWAIEEDCVDLSSAACNGVWTTPPSKMVSSGDEQYPNGDPSVVARDDLPTRDGLAKLSEMERKVVERAASGVHTKEIAYSLGLADATVRVLLMRAARKCGVRDRFGLTELWLSRKHVRKSSIRTTAQ